MKIISKFLFLLLLIFTVSGCGSFFGGNEAVGISSIETEELEDGSIKLIINYTDEEMEPVEIVIPKGEEGLKGNGIKNIEPVPGDETTKIVVTYTDTSMPTVEFDIPHGTEIEEILVVDKEGYVIKTDEQGNEFRIDENGNSIEEEGKFFSGTKYLKVIYTEIDSETNEKKSSMFELPKGESGQDGNGIEYIKAGKLLEDGTIEENVLNSDGSIDIQFKYTQVETAQTINIPANKGILDIKGSETLTQYVIEITYTTKDPETGEYEKAKPIKFDKPIFTQWLKGKKTDKLQGNIGDYFYDEDDNQIYMKKPLEDDPLGYWDLIVDFGQGQHGCIVTFDANGGYILSGENNEDKKVTVDYSIQSGNYFYNYENFRGFPNVQHPDGLIFVGWYTDYKLTPTVTKFTDLTIVNTDIILYAIWQEK